MHKLQKIKRIETRAAEMQVLKTDKMNYLMMQHMITTEMKRLEIRHIWMNSLMVACP
jgi:hypothetical protein